MGTSIIVLGLLKALLGKDLILIPEPRLNFRVLFPLLFGRWNDYGPPYFEILFFVAPSPIFAVSLFFFCKDETERSSESSGSACDLKAKLPSLPKRVTQKQRERKSFLGFKKFLLVLYCMFVLHLCERSEQ